MRLHLHGVMVRRSRVRARVDASHRRALHRETGCGNQDAFFLRVYTFPWFVRLRNCASCLFPHCQSPDTNPLQNLMAIGNHLANLGWWRDRQKGLMGRRDELATSALASPPNATQHRPSSIVHRPSETRLLGYSPFYIFFFLLKSLSPSSVIGILAAHNLDSSVQYIQSLHGIQSLR